MIGVTNGHVVNLRMLTFACFVVLLPCYFFTNIFTNSFTHAFYQFIATFAVGSHFIAPELNEDFNEMRSLQFFGSLLEFLFRLVPLFDSPF